MPVYVCDRTSDKYMSDRLGTVSVTRPHGYIIFLMLNSAEHFEMCSPFSGKKKTNAVHLSSPEFAQRVVKVKSTLNPGPVEPDMPSLCKQCRS